MNTEIPKLTSSNWSTADKYNLLQGIKAYGSRDIDNISQMLPEKTPDEIKMAIDHYRKIASNHPVIQKTKSKCKSKRRSPMPTIPLAAWAKLLTDNIGLDELTTETATAVRMIAELENLPEPASVENFDFRHVYHTIANAMEGRPLEYNKRTVTLLNKCILETALSSRAFINSSALKDMMESISSGKEDTSKVAKPPAKEVIALLSNLASQKSYNPLQIPEKYLKPVIALPSQ